MLNNPELSRILTGRALNELSALTWDRAARACMTLYRTMKTAVSEKALFKEV